MPSTSVVKVDGFMRDISARPERPRHQRYVDDRVLHCDAGRQGAELAEAGYFAAYTASALAASVASKAPRSSPKQRE